MGFCGRPSITVPTRMKIVVVHFVIVLVCVVVVNLLIAWLL